MPTSETLNSNLEVMMTAINEAELGDDTTVDSDTTIVEPDTSTTPDTKTDDPLPDANDTVVADAVTAKTKPDADALTAEELAELGIRPMQAGERPNKIPRDRVIQMLGKAVRKERETAKKSVDEWTGKHKTVEGELDRFRKLDQLATTDPEKYVRTLGAMFPEKYGRFVQSLDGKGEDKKVPQSKDDPEPQPTGKFPDGTTGYTAEEFAAHQAWTRRQAVRDANESAAALIAKELKPFKDREAVVEEQSARVKRAQQQITEAQDTWGDDFPKPNSKEEAELGKFLDDHPEMSFKVGVREWIRPRITRDRTKMREEIIKELDARGKKQERTPPSSTKVVRDPNTPKSNEEVIHEAIAAAGLK